MLLGQWRAQIQMVLGQMTQPVPAVPADRSYHLWPENGLLLGLGFWRGLSFYSHFNHLKNRHKFLSNDIVFLDFTRLRFDKRCWTNSAMPASHLHMPYSPPILKRRLEPDNAISGTSFANPDCGGAGAC
jgi:hypothetical protein